MRIGPIARGRKARIAVVDIGSNSIRVVVYDRLSRAPVPVFNEKVLCGLGRDLSRTGRLHPEGTAMALRNLTRFRRLLDGMGVRSVDVLATAAVREAEDGPAFVAEVERRCNFDVTVISGMEEARLSAMGALSGAPGADGVMGDLGGGSLELVALDRGAFGHQVTLPLGPFRLMNVEKGRAEARAIIARHFEEQSWLADYRGRTFYPVGGAWRSLAKVHMARSKYPVHVIHQYAVPASEVVALAAVIGRQGRASLERLPQVNRKRLETLPYGGLVLEGLLQAMAPATVVFSAYGLREGHLFDLLREKERATDPLLHTCSEIARQLDRFGEASGIARWTRDLFVGETEAAARIREAACLLSDFCWAEHPDYRAEHAFLRTLRLAVVGIEHAERVFLAAAIYVRYGGILGDRVTRSMQHVLAPDEMKRAELLGATLRLGLALSGGVPALLEKTRLEQVDDTLVLSLPAELDTLSGDIVERRLEAVAKIMTCPARIAIGE
ncbi:MAG: Ppx/GppA family phosphatase [Inquilinus sp.]|nr:Ppx/GppA family phosphatase [Inquilinus sp.]